MIILGAFVINCCVTSNIAVRYVLSLLRGFQRAPKPRTMFGKTATRLPATSLNTERERNVLFNDALNTFYLWLYGVRHMVKDHSDSEKGNPLPPYRLLLSINIKGSFICTMTQTG